MVGNQWVFTEFSMMVSAQTWECNHSYLPRETFVIFKQVPRNEPLNTCLKWPSCERDCGEQKDLGFSISLPNAGFSSSSALTK